MENGTEHNYETDNQQQLALLLLVPMMEEAQTAQKSRRSKQRFVALILLVSVTVAAAVMTVLMTGSSSTGFNPIASAFSFFLGTARKKYESCASPWWIACGDKLSCYDNGS